METLVICPVCGQKCFIERLKKEECPYCECPFDQSLYLQGRDTVQNVSKRGVWWEPRIIFTSNGENIFSVVLPDEFVRDHAYGKGIPFYQAIKKFQEGGFVVDTVLWQSNDHGITINGITVFIPAKLHDLLKKLQNSDLFKAAVATMERKMHIKFEDEDLKVALDKALRVARNLSNIYSSSEPI